MCILLTKGKYMYGYASKEYENLIQSEDNTPAAIIYKTPHNAAEKLGRWSTWLLLSCVGWDRLFML